MIHSNPWLYYADDTTLKNNLIKDFDPEVLEYNLEIPYSTQKLRVRAEKNDANAEGPVIKPELVGSNPNDPDKQWLDNLPDLFKASQNGIVDLTVTVTSEASATVGRRRRFRRQPYLYRASAPG